jgi:hypothetical protein
MSTTAYRTLTQAEVDQLTAEEYALYLVDGELADVDEEEYQHFLLSHLAYDV